MMNSTPKLQKKWPIYGIAQLMRWRTKMTDKPDITGVLHEAIALLEADLSMQGGKRFGRSAKFELLQKICRKEGS
jgi:hypothetical protein